MLLPTVSTSDIKRLNHLSNAQLSSQPIDTNAEIARALLVSSAVTTSNDVELHYAGDLFDVFSNIQRWNDELESPRGEALWGKRTIKYFVYDAATGLFAPLKFCAYINAIPTEASGFLANFQLMSMPLLCLAPEI